MKIAISNIAWTAQDDEYMYKALKEEGVTGLEIAPTRIFEENPYECIDKAGEFAKDLKARFGLSIVSMQSIWYARSEKIWGSDLERRALIDYTKKAVLFAAAIGCKNLVFGCPKNRVKPEDGDLDVAVSFFKELGDFASAHGTVIAMEANPPIYNTNFLNTTAEAIDFIKLVNSDGFLLNLDYGTMIANEETIDCLKGNAHLIHHVHISEPGLKPIEDREGHRELLEFLMQNHYDGFVSIEMAKTNSCQDVLPILRYLSRMILGDGGGVSCHFPG